MRSTVICSCICAFAWMANSSTSTARRMIAVYIRVNLRHLRIKRFRRSTQIVHNYNLLMRKLLFVAALFLVLSSAFASRFGETLLDKTMRVNYFHTGNDCEEVIAVHAVGSHPPS